MSKIGEDIKAKRPEIEARYRSGNALDTIMGIGSNLGSKALSFFQKKKEDSGLAEDDQPQEKSKAQALWDKYMKKKDQEETKPKSLLDTVKDKAAQAKEGVKARVGNWKDRMAAKEEANKQRLEENKEKLKHKPVEARYRGKNVIDMMMEKATAAKDAIMDFFDMGDSLGDMKGGKGKRGRKGKLGRLGRIGGKLGRGAMAVGRGALSVGKAALGFGGGLGRLALGAGRLALPLAGMAASGLASAAGAVGGGLLTLATSPLLPVLAGAAAIGAVGYGLYKGYKYLTRNDATDIDKIRLLQYGLPHEYSGLYHKVFALEQMVEEKAQRINEGDIKIQADKLDWEAITKIFDIDPNTDQGKDQLAKVQEWFYSRFVPAYIKNRAALYKADPKLKIDSYGKLKGVALRTYLSTCEVKSETYSIKTSPFTQIPELPDTQEAVKQAIASLMKIADKVIKDPKAVIAKPEDKGQSQTEKSLDKANAAIKAQTAKDAATSAAGGAAINKTVASANKIENADAEVPVSSSISSVGSSSATSPKVDMSPLMKGDRADGFMVLQKGVSLDGLNPALLENFRGMVEEYGLKTNKKVVVTDGFRTYDEQARLHAKYPDKAAPPGRSLHEFGLAVDVDSKTLNEMDDLGLMRKYGFTRPVGKEPWHTEAAGIQSNLNKAKTDPAFADGMIKASLYRGGGGYGTLSDATRYRRNPQLAYDLFDMDGSPIKSTEQTDIPKPVTVPIKPPETTAVASQAQSNDSKEIGNITKSPPPVRTSAITTTAADTETEAPTSQVEASGTFYGVKPPTSGSKDEIKKLIADVGNKIGVDPATLQTFAAIESGLNPNAKASTSSAGGLFQFIDSTWNEMVSKYGSKYGLQPGVSKFDPVANSLMGAEYIKQNQKALSSVVSNPGPDALYAAHFLGAGGARTLYKADQNASAVDIMPKAASANKAIFYQGSRPKSVGEVKQTLTAKVSTKAQEFGIDMPTSGKVEDRFASVAGPSDSITPAPSTTSPSTPAQVRKAIQTESPKSQVVSPTHGVPAAQSIRPAETTRPMRTEMPNNTPIDTTKPVVDILTKSYDVQTAMLDVLKVIAEKVRGTESPVPASSVKEDKPVRPKSLRAMDSMPKLPIGLDRRLV